MRERTLEHAGRRALLGAGLVMAGFLAVLATPALHWSGLKEFSAWIEAEGAWSAPVFAATTTLAVALGAPRLLFAALGGSLFGWWVGSLLAELGMLAGCLLTFTYARSLGRPWIAARMPARWRRLDALVAQHGMAVTLIIRWLPVGSCHLTNLFLALSAVSAGEFLLGSLLGSLPTTVTYAVLGGATRDSPTASLVSAACLLLATSAAWVLAARCWGIATRVVSSLRTPTIAAGDVLVEPAAPAIAASHPASAGTARRHETVWQRRRRKRSLRRPLLGACALLALHVLRRLPLGLAQGVGGLLGRAAAHMPCRSRTQTRVNLGLCFPDWPASQRRRLERLSLVELGRTLVELPRLLGADAESVLRDVRHVTNEECLQRALDRGRGVILAGIHLGAWELVGLYGSAHHRMTTLYRPLRMGEVQEFCLRGRQRCGARLVPATLTGVRAACDALRRNELVGIMPDQDPGPGEHVFAPFFGVPARTTTLVSRLAQRYGAPVVLACAERLPRGRGFRLRFAEGSPEIGSADPERSARALNADIERLVREVPHQYLWRYRRFRHRPDGSKHPYR